MGRYAVAVCLWVIRAFLLTGSCVISADEHSPQRWALLVGVNDYIQLNDLQYCQRDAESLQQTLLSAGFPEQHVQVITSGAAAVEGQPFKANFERAVKLTLGLADEGDMVLVSFSGHGIQVDGTTYLCPTEADENDPLRTMIPLQWVYQQLTACKASQRMFWVDACRNEPRRSGSRTARSKDVASINRELARPPEGVLVLASCTEGQISWEDDRLRQGVFMHCLLEGLSGKADREVGDNNDIVSLLELYKYAHLNTKRRVADRWKELQTPELFGRLAGDFDLVAASAPVPQDILKRAQEAALSESLKGEDRFQVLVEIAALQGLAGDTEAARSSFRLAHEWAAQRLKQGKTVPGRFGYSSVERGPFEVLAEGQARAGFADDAIETATRIEHADAKAVVLAEIAVAQGQQGNVNAAKSTLMSARSISDPPGSCPEMFNSRFRIAIAYARIGDIDSVRDVVESMDQNSDWLRDRLARTLADAGHCDTGLAFAREMGSETTEPVGWSHGSTKAEAIAHVAKAQARLGRRAEAARTFELAIHEVHSMGRSLECSLAVLQSQVEAGCVKEARSTLNRLSTEVPSATDERFEAQGLSALLAVIQAKAGNAAASRQTLDKTIASVLGGEFPNQGGTQVCMALVEVGRSEDVVHTMKRCFEAKDPGISEDWPELICLLARHRAFDQANQAVDVLRQAFPDSLLKLQLATGLLQSAGLVEIPEFGTTTAFRFPTSRRGTQR